MRHIANMPALHDLMWPTDIASKFGLIGPIAEQCEHQYVEMHCLTVFAFDSAFFIACWPVSVPNTNTRMSYYLSDS